MHHEEYYEDDDDEIGYHEDVVISESNHTIPNFDEANEIRMLTEAANNSLRTMEEHYNPPKKRRSRKKKIDGEQGLDEGSKPKKRRRPQHKYFNELGEPTSVRTESLLKGLENLNLPIATAGTAPMSPPAPKPNPVISSPRADKPAIVGPGSVMQHPPRMGLSEVPRNLPPSRMNTPYKMPELSIPQMTSPQMVSPHLKSPNMISPHIVSPSLTSPQMISPRMVSPGQQPSQLSPRTISATQKKHPLLSTILSVTSPGGQALGSNVPPPSGMVSPMNQMVRMPRNVAPGPFPFTPRPKVPEVPPQRMAAPVAPRRQGPLPGVSSVAQAQFSSQQPRQQLVSAPSTIPNPAPRLPQQMQSIPNVPVPRLQRPDIVNATLVAVASVPRQPLQYVPRQPTVSSVPTNQQPIPAQVPPVNHEAVLPSESPLANIPKSVPRPVPIEQAPMPVQSEFLLSNRPEKTQEENVVTKDVGVKSNTDTVPSSQGTTEPKPIQELIKSELLAAAWQSRQPVAPVSLPDKKIETNTLSNTISRVEERLRLAAQAETQKHKSEISIPAGQSHPPKYSESAQVHRLQVPMEGSVRLPTAQIQGSTLPPISTLQTKLPPGLVPSALPPASSVATINILNASSIANKQPNTFRPSAIATSVLESPPVTEEKEANSVVPGQIPIPRGALKSPVSYTGLGKDPMLSDPTLAIPSTQLSTSMPNSDALKSPTHPLITGKLPAPFPLAFAPGLPPVGLMMQPLPPLGFGRPGMMPQARPPGEVLSSNNAAPPGSAGITNTSVPPTSTSSQLRSPTADKHKVLSSTLQSPPASQPNPLDLIMEVMKKEISGNPQAFLQGQVQKDLIGPGVLPQAPIKNEKSAPGVPPRFPTPGPTMEMLMAIMQREVAAAQIQAQVAALHAAHAQAQVQVSHSTAAHNSQASLATTVSQQIRPPLTGSRIAQLQAQARATPQPALRSPLPPVSTMMSINTGSPAMPNQIRPPNDVQPTVRPTTQQQLRPQAPPPVASSQNQRQVCMSGYSMC